MQVQALFIFSQNQSNSWISTESSAVKVEATTKVAPAFAPYRSGHLEMASLVRPASHSYPVGLATHRRSTQSRRTDTVPQRTVKRHKSNAQAEQIPKDDIV